MSTATILAAFALIIAASCSWQVILAVLHDRQDKVIKETFETVMAWMETQEVINAEFREWMQATESTIFDLSERLDVLESRPLEFDWEVPGDE